MHLERVIALTNYINCLENDLGKRNTSASLADHEEHSGGEWQGTSQPSLFLDLGSMLPLPSSFKRPSKLGTFPHLLPQIVLLTREAGTRMLVSRGSGGYSFSDLRSLLIDCVRSRKSQEPLLRTGLLMRLDSETI